MKRFIPAIAVAAGTFAIVLPATAAKAETWYLVSFVDLFTYANSSNAHFFTLPMESEEQCEVAGSKLAQSAKSGKFNISDKWGVDKIYYECVKGK